MPLYLIWINSRVARISAQSLQSLGRLFFNKPTVESVTEFIQ